MNKNLYYRMKFTELLDYYPILKNFIYSANQFTLSSEKINNFLGYKFCEYKTVISLEFVNNLMNAIKLELLEKYL